MKRFFIIPLLLLSLQVFAINNRAVDNFLSTEGLKNASISLQIKNLNTGEILASYQPNIVLAPASTQKLWTTIAALELLGPDFRFSTYLETDGQIKKGVLKGNLYIRGTGDPSLGSQAIENQEFLSVWIEEIRKAGINKIDGAVIADMSIFEGDEANPEWLWDDLGASYATGTYGINYLDNLTHITLQSGEKGTIAKIVEVNPTVPNLTFDNRVVCSSMTYDDFSVHGVPYCFNHSLVGFVPANNKQFTIRGDIPNPGLLLAQHFSTELQNAGIKVTKKPDYAHNDFTLGRTVLYEHQSAPLTEILTEINHQSNNIYTEAVFRYLASQLELPCTLKNSVQVLVNFYSEHGIKLHPAFIKDGCGLASRDAFSAQLFIQLLEFIKHSENFNTFYATLPVAGQSGTLRNFLKNTVLDGKVHAKSGSTSNIRAFAGFIEADNGEDLIFSVIVNNAECSSRQVQKEIEKFLLNFYVDYLNR